MNQEGHGPLGRISQAIVKAQGVGFTQGQRGHCVAIHADGPAGPSQIAV